jgi:translation initiation factor IF-2
VIESKLDRGRGAVSTVLVKRGTLKRGDIVVAGASFGRVRACSNERGRAGSSAGPSRARWRSSAWTARPDPGEAFAVVDDRGPRPGADRVPDSPASARRPGPPWPAACPMADFMAKMHGQEDLGRCR